MKSDDSEPLPATVSSAGNVRSRLDSLTGLRWWAAFGVFAYHMANLAPLRHQSLLNVGYTGVSFFFVLSGFVLTWSAKPSTGVRQFWWRRFARIWPAHFVALIPCLFVFYSLSTPPDDQSWVKQFSLPVIALSVILVQGFPHSLRCYSQAIRRLGLFHVKHSSISFTPW